jgi:hypothetical protein
MPLDAEPSDRGRWVIDEDGVARPHEPLFDGQMDRLVAHWATCPSSDEHRKGEA